MSVPARDSLPDLADEPASGPLEPEQTELANGVRADVHPRLADGVRRRIPAACSDPRQIEPICTPQAISAEATRTAPKADIARGANAY